MNVSVTWRNAVGQPWAPLSPLPATNYGFREADRYLFRKPGDGWSLLVDDQPLTSEAFDPECWVWEPGFFAGEVCAELIDPGGARSDSFALDVAPDPTKVGRDMFNQMLDDLWTEDPTLVVGSEPATRQIGDLGPVEDPWLAFARLRRYGTEFVRALQPIQSRPRRTLRVTRALVPLRRARRVDRRTGTALIRSKSVGALSGIVPISESQLDVPVPEDTVDAAANRTLHALLAAVLYRSTVVLDRLGKQVQEEESSETRTALASRWPARKRYLEQLLTSLRTAIRGSPFRDVTRSEITSAGLTAIAADPTYARAWSRGWRALRHGVDANPTTERLWISPSWEIYERWCFLRLSRLLVTAAPDWRWDRQRKPVRLIGMRDTTVAELALQPVFKATGANASGRWSVSRQRVPDLVLTIKTESQTRFMVLDAKYRTARTNVLDAMASAHIYQDSLRIGMIRPEATLLLVPASGGAPWLEEQDFQEKHRVGVYPFAPGRDTHLPNWLTALLN